VLTPKASSVYSSKDIMAQWLSGGATLCGAPAHLNAKTIACKIADY